MATNTLTPPIIGALEQGELTSIPVADIVPSPYQPRREFPAEKLQELAASLATSGLLQPIAVRVVDDGYELIAGERRWRAAQLLSWTDIPAVVRKVDDGEAATLALVENLQRDDLTPLEEAEAFIELMTTRGWSQQELARRTGIPRSTIGDRVRMTELPAVWYDLIASGELQPSHAPALHRLRELPYSTQEKLVESLKENWLFEQCKERGEPMSIVEFEEELHNIAAEFVTPLEPHPSRPYDKPIIDPAAYDGATARIRMPGEKEERLYAIEPEKFTPLLKAARRSPATDRAETKPKQSRLPKGVKLPKDIKRLEWEGWGALRGAQWLVMDGRWCVREKVTNANSRTPWDPEDLGELDPKRLRLVVDRAGKVRGLATTQAEVLEEARAVWSERWKERWDQLAEERATWHYRQFRSGNLFEATGAGSAILLGELISVSQSCYARDHAMEMAIAMELPDADELREHLSAYDYQRREQMRAWFKKQDFLPKEQLATAVAIVIGNHLPRLSSVITAEQKHRFAEIENLPTSWFPAPKEKVVPSVGALLKQLSDREIDLAGEDEDDDPDEEEFGGEDEE